MTVALRASARARTSAPLVPRLFDALALKYVPGKERNVVCKNIVTVMKTVERFESLKLAFESVIDGCRHANAAVCSAA